MDIHNCEYILHVQTGYTNIHTIRQRIAEYSKGITNAASSPLQFTLKSRVFALLYLYAWTHVDSFAVFIIQKGLGSGRHKFVDVVV